MRERLYPYRSLFLLIGALFLTLLSFSIPASMFARWAAVAVLVLVSSNLYSELKPFVNKLISSQPESRTQIAKTAIPYVLVTIGTMIALFPISIGDMPVSQDHINHYFSTHILVNDIIPSGRFFGWTDRIGTGYPFGDLYGTTCYLFTGLLHLISFGLIELDVSYAFGIVLVWLIPALAVTAWACRLGGPMSAVAAGMLFVLDMGADREGGWVYAMFHGVWPQQLGAGIWLFSLLSLFRLAEKMTTRRLSVAVILMGLSLWVHPMNTVVLALSGLLLFAVRLFGFKNNFRIEVSKEALVVIVALFFGGLFGLGWAYRMMIAGDNVYAYSAYWESTERLMSGLLNGKLFENGYGFVAFAAVIGLLSALRKGGRFGLLSVILLALFILIGSMDLVIGSDLGLAGGTFGIMQYRRFSIPAKLLFFALAAGGFTAVWAGIKSYLPNQNTNRIIKVTATVLFAPFIWGAIQGALSFFPSPVMKPLTLSQLADRNDILDIQEILESEKPKCEKTGCKAVYWEKGGHGGLYPVKAMADAGFGWIPTGKLPANNYLWLNSSNDPQTISSLQVSLVISKWKLNDDLFKQIKKQGRHYVYRVKTDPDAAFVKIEGKGKAEISSYDAENIVIEVEDVNDNSALVLRMPPYKKWKAYQNNRKLSLSSKEESGMLFARIDNIKDGKIELKYKDSIAEDVLFIVSMLILILCFVGMIIKPHSLPIPFGNETLQIIYKVLVVFLGVALTAALIISFVVSQKAINRIWLTGEPSSARVLSVIHRQGISELNQNPKQYCVQPYTRNPNVGCSEYDLKPYLSPARKRKGVVPSCLAVGIPPNGITEIVFEIPSETARIKGFLTLLDGAVLESELITTTDDGSVEKTTIDANSKRGIPFIAEVQGKAKQVKWIFSSNKQSHVCIEAVALSK